MIIYSLSTTTRPGSSVGLERLATNQKVGGSSPSRVTMTITGRWFHLPDFLCPELSLLFDLAFLNHLPRRSCFQYLTKPFKKGLPKMIHHFQQSLFLCRLPQKADSRQALFTAFYKFPYLSSWPRRPRRKPEDERKPGKQPEPWCQRRCDRSCGTPKP